MSLWVITFLFLWIAFFLFKADLFELLDAIATKGHIRVLTETDGIFSELENMLQAGIIPSQKAWDNLQTLPQPWSNLAKNSLQELRAAGGALTPTLKRLRNLVKEQRAALLHAHSKSSQALAQALVCITLVPLLGCAFYCLVPEIEQRFMNWIIACGLTFLLSCSAALWLLLMAQEARWGGVQRQHRSWILDSQCAGERLLALVRAGTPADLAWLQACQLLSQRSFELASAWGHSIWDDPQAQTKGQAEQTLINTGTNIRKAIQIGLMEGRPCIERIETALEALREEMRAHIERELSLLPTRTLKPLFLLVAPSLLGLLAYGIWLASSEALKDGFYV